MSSIGERMKHKRIERGLSQKHIADIAGVTNAAVSKWEANGGDSMSAVVALRISRHLKVNPFWLIRGEGEPTDTLHVPDISAEAQQLARKIDNLPAGFCDALHRLLTVIQ
ncbi:MAG: helix-turn-helix domain-containing protein [Gammaproteobacteria bacterium]|nr:helix-turn-helix domain-containing protein [Gammaproteobacteria bacterium]